ncbi:unnamed protein product, partial [marine sediment metagenome]
MHNMHQSDIPSPNVLDEKLRKAFIGWQWKKFSEMNKFADMLADSMLPGMFGGDGREHGEIDELSINPAQQVHDALFRTTAFDRLGYEQSPDLGFRPRGKRRARWLGKRKPARPAEHAVPLLDQLSENVLDRPTFGWIGSGQNLSENLGGKNRSDGLITQPTDTAPVNIVDTVRCADLGPTGFATQHDRGRERIAGQRGDQHLEGNRVEERRRTIVLRVEEEYVIKASRER